VAITRQTDFSAGEISPLLHSRSDAAFFAKALRACKNFFISKQGAAVSRPGTTYVGTVLNSPNLIEPPFVAADDDRAVLIPFNAADDESFVLVFQAGTIQFISRGGYVEEPVGTRYQVATPYAWADLRKLHYAQVGEVLTLVCPGWDPAELRHVGDAPPTWSLAKAVTSPLPLDGTTVAYYDIDDPATTTTGFQLLVPDAWTAGTYAADDVVTNDGNVYECLVGGVSGPGPTGTGQEIVEGFVTWRFLSAANEPDSDHVAREWQWQVTALCRRTDTGELFETLPTMISESNEGDYGSDPVGTGVALTGDLWAIYPDFPMRLRRRPTSAFLPGASTEFTIIAYNFYRGRGGLFGFLGQTTTREFVDVGDEPDYAQQPPVGTDPFGTTGVATTAAAPFDIIHDDRAAAVAYFEARRVFGGLTRREADLVASAAGNFDNFDERKLFHIAGESIIYAVASRRRGRIRHLVAMDRLLVLTSAAAYHAGGQPGTPGWDFDSVWVSLIEEVGSNDVTPAVVDGTVFYARAKGRGLRGLVPAGNQGGYQGFDASQLAEHLFRGTDKQVVDMSYAEDPWGILWVVLEDGTLLSLSYQKDGQLAWARHLMTYVSDDEDEDGNPITVTTGTVEAVCAVPEGDEDAVYLVVKRTVGGTDYRYIERMTSRHERGGCTLNAVGDDEPDVIETEPDYICVDSAVRYVGPAVSTFTGLEHLEGMEVYVVAQGHPVIGPYTVTGAELAIEEELAENITDADDAPLGPKLVAYVGLPYHCDLELLDVAGGEARSRNKQVTHVGFEVDNAKGVLVGQDFDNLDVQPSREVADDFGTAPLQTNFFFVPVRGSYDYSARAVLRQSEPLPVTVLGITRRIDGGDEGGSSQ
jgi:hypothetical protein